MSSRAPRRALVTGAAGFVGCHICRALLAEGWQVLGLIRPGGSTWRFEGLREMDLEAVDLGADRAGVERVVGLFEPELVVQAAAYSAYAERDLVAGVAADLLGLAHLLAALPGKCRLVALGSSLEVRAGEGKIGHEAPLEPAGTRGTLRAAATLLVLDEARARRLEAGVLRLYSVYGPWEAEHRLVPKALRAALLGAPLPLTAEPWPTHDFIFAEDVAEACLAAARAKAFPGRVFNVCTGIATSDGELVAAAERATGRKIVRQPGAWRSRHPERQHWCGDPEPTAEGLGWRARRTLEEGLAITAAWTLERLRREG